MKTTCRIKEYIVITFIFSKLYSVLSYYNRISLPHFKNGNTCLLTHYLKLFDSCRTVNIAGYKQRPVTLIFKHESDFGAVGSFT